MNRIICLLIFLTVSLTANGRSTGTNGAHGFVENKGQIIDQDNNPNPAVRFLWCGDGMNVQLRQNSFSYEVVKFVKDENTNSKKEELHLPERTTSYFHRVDVELVGANTAPQIIAGGKSHDYSNYYTTGTLPNGVVNVHHYSTVLYKDIYPHIDMEFSFDESKGLNNHQSHPVKYNFIIKPGGDINNIRLKYHGAKSTSLTNGTIHISTAYQELEESIPLSYVQETGNEVQVYYKQLATNSYGFQAGEYNRDQTLIIDPWATYYGGIHYDAAHDLAVDSTGNSFLVGTTLSSNTIATFGTFQTTQNGMNDAYLVKFNPAGIREWGTYIGTADHDGGSGVALAPGGDIVITGELGDPGLNTPGAQGSNYTSNYDAFIARFTPIGTRIWLAYCGGAEFDWGEKICVNKLGESFIVGTTQSSNNIATPGCFMGFINAGNEAAFLAKFSPTGTKLWGTYYGCTPPETYGYCIAVDSSSNVIIGGKTNCQSGIATANAHKPNYSDNGDAFITKFSTNGARLWGTYYGGPGIDRMYGLTTDLTGNIYFTGRTQSQAGIATPGMFQSVFTAGGPFLGKLDPDGNRLWGTYFSCANNIADEPMDITVDISGNVLLAAHTTCTTLSTPGTYQQIAAGGNDGVIAKFNATGNRLWTTYFGGNLSDHGLSVATDAAENVYIAGATLSTIGIATPNTQQTSIAGAEDAFLTCLSPSGSMWPASGILGNIILPDQSLCPAGQPDLLTGGMPITTTSMPFQYLWLESSTGPVAGFTPAPGVNDQQDYLPPYATSTRWYTRVATAGSSSDTSYPVRIFVNNAVNATITPTGPITICENHSAVLTASSAGGYLYQWKLNNNDLPGAVASTYAADAAGAYHVVIYYNGCYSTSDSVWISTYPVPGAVTIAAGDTSLCLGDTVKLQTSIIAPAYQWKKNGAFISGATNSAYSAYSPGTYRLFVEDSYSNSCRISDEPIVVTTLPSPHPTIQKTGQDLFTTTAYPGYQWYAGGIPIPGATNASYYVASSGSYSLEVTNEYGCTGMSLSINVNVVGVGETSTPAGIYLYPNPTEGLFMLQHTAKNTSAAWVQIVDITGRVLLTQKTTHQIETIDMSSFEPGVYLVRYNIGDSLYTVMRMVKR